MEHQEVCQWTMGKKKSFTIVFLGVKGGGVKEGCHERAKDDIGANKHVEGTGKHA
jgi:hypothetical protein